MLNLQVKGNLIKDALGKSDIRSKRSNIGQESLDSSRRANIGHENPCKLGGS